MCWSWLCPFVNMQLFAKPNEPNGLNSNDIALFPMVSCMSVDLPCWQGPKEASRDITQIVKLLLTSNVLLSTRWKKNPKAKSLVSTVRHHKKDVYIGMHEKWWPSFISISSTWHLSWILIANELSSDCWILIMRSLTLAFLSDLNWFNCIYSTRIWLLKIIWNHVNIVNPRMY